MSWRRTAACSTRLVGGTYYGLNGDPDGRVRDHHRGPGPVRRLPDPGQRLPPVLARRLHARQPRRARTGSPASRAPMQGYEALLSGTPTNALDEVGVYPADQRRAAGRRVPAVREPGRGAVRLHRRPVHPARGNELRRGRARRPVLHAADQDRQPGVGHGQPGPGAAVPALASRRERIRPRLSSRRARPARTTGRRCPRRAARRRPTSRPSATTLASCSRCTRSCATTSAGPTAPRRATSGSWNTFTGVRVAGPRSRSTWRPTPASRSNCRSRT